MSLSGDDFTGADLARDPTAASFRKRPVLVAVQFAAAPGTVQTLEGPVRYAAGDALLTGVEGERWPVARAHFERAYAPVPPVRMGEPGGYRKQPLTVRARRIDTPFCVRLAVSGDTLRGRPGDWLVQYGPGDYGIVQAKVFAATYEPVA